MWFHSFVNAWPQRLLSVVCLVLLGGCGSLGMWQGNERFDPGGDPEFVSRYESAINAINQREYENARVVLEELVLMNPLVTAPYVNLGIIAETQGDRDRAKEWYMRALEVDSALPEALNQLGVLAREEGQFRKAQEYYQRALAADDSMPQIHYNLGILYDLYLGDYRKAIGHYERYQALTGGDNQRVAQWLVDLKRRAKQEAP